MKAILLTGYGGSDKLQLGDRPDPEPGQGQLQVRVRSASLNPIDWKLRSGAYQKMMPLELPAILGRDAAGEVSKVGAGVTGFKPGDRVMGLVMGAYAELVVADVNAWAKVPSGLELEAAGAVPLVVLTGDQLVATTLENGSGAGKTVLVTGAIGGVGRTAVWSAKGRGAKVWAGVRKKQLHEAEKLGADGVVALDDPDALGRLPELDAIADTVGGETIKKLFGKVKAGGAIGSVVGEPEGAKAKGLKVHAVFAHPDSKRLAEIGAAIARGELVIPVAKRFPLADARAAQDLAEAGGLAKVLLIP